MAVTALTTSQVLSNEFTPKQSEIRVFRLLIPSVDIDGTVQYSFEPGEYGVIKHVYVKVGGSSADVTLLFGTKLDFAANDANHIMRTYFDNVNNVVVKTGIEEYWKNRDTAFSKKMYIKVTENGSVAATGIITVDLFMVVKK